MYAESGRPSIPPEHLLKSSILMALYSIRSEREFCERLQYDLLFKWFLDLNVETPGFEHSSFSKTGSGSCGRPSPASSSPPCWRRPSGGSCSPANTSA
jgi:transposase